MPRIILHGSLSQGLLTLFWTALLCAAAVFLLRRLFRVGEEGYRKLLHIAILAVLSVWLFAFRDWRLCALTMLTFVALAYPILYGLGKIPGFAARFPQRTQGEFRKSLCVAGSMFLVLTLICWGWLEDQRIALASLYAWGPGDAAAALIGKRYGKTKIGKKKKKSLEGSLAMLILSTLSVFVILAWRSSAPLPTIAAVALLTGAASAAAELMDLSGFDTYFCPATAMTVLCLCRFLLGPIF